MNIFKKTAKFITGTSETALNNRIEASQKGEFISEGPSKAIENIQGQVKDLFDKVYSSDNSIIKDRLNAIQDSMDGDSVTLKGLYNLTLKQPIGALYDILGDRGLFESGANTLADTAHTITSSIPYATSILTGVSTESSFKAKNYSVTTGFNGNLYRGNRLEQLGTGSRDLVRGLLYGNSNNQEGVKTGLFGGFEAINVFNYGVSQSIRNLHDWAFASSVRTFSGFKNIVSPILLSPINISSWAVSKINPSVTLPSLKDKLPNVNFNNYRKTLDEDGEKISRTARFKSIFQPDQTPPDSPPKAN